MLLNILIVEDSKTAAKGIALYITKHSDYTVDYKIVETREDMKLALQERIWDAILCDHYMPYFDSESAFDLYKELELDIPFIIVSGAIEEEAACEAMKMGVHDYIMKDKIQRLVPALERELKRAEERKLYREAEEKETNILKNALDTLKKGL
jgi:DNA-binding NtrC family response regulator